MSIQFIESQGIYAVKRRKPRRQRKHAIQAPRVVGGAKKIQEVSRSDKNPNRKVLCRVSEKTQLEYKVGKKRVRITI